LGVTVTGAGEAHCNPGAQNAVDLVDMTPSRGVPVACGPEEPLDGFQEFPKAWRTDADTFYGVPVPRSTRRPVAESAPELLVSLLRQAAAPVRLVVLGNATNVALAMERAPDIKGKIERIFFMGGAVWQKGNIIVPGFTDHYKNTVAEWNVLIDPVATQMVLRSGVPVTLVTLDGTKDQKVTRDDVARFTAAARTPGARFFSDVFGKAMWFVDSGEYYFWDALTAGVTVNPGFCKTERLDLDVIVAYSDRTNVDPLPPYGALRWDGKPRRNFDPYFTGQTFLSDEGSAVDVCVQSDPDGFKPDLIRTVNLGGGRS
jgi:pyrimidine-specific ribonucleoside hydrolase